MSFKIGSDKAHYQPYRYPKHVTAECYWQFISFAGNEFIAGIVKITNNDIVAASMCRSWDDDEDTVLEFCQALLRKAFGQPDKTRDCRRRKPTNIFNREIIKTRETNPWQLFESVEGGYIWEFELKPTVKTNCHRR